MFAESLLRKVGLAALSAVERVTSAWMQEQQKENQNNLVDPYRLASGHGLIMTVQNSLIHIDYLLVLEVRMRLVVNILMRLELRSQICNERGTHV